MLPLPLGLSRVLDLTGSVAGATATRSLADLGAEIVVVEAPGGSALRRAEPALFDHLQRNKLACAVDLSQPEGRDLLLRLAAACDFVFVDAEDARLAAAGLDHEAFAGARADIIYVCVALGRDRPGLGVAAAAAALTALFHRRATGEGGRVDVSFPRLAASLQSVAVVAASAGATTALPDLPPSGCYRCAEGAVAVVVRSDEQLRALRGVIGAPEAGDEPALRNALARWLAGREADAAARALLDAGVAAQALLDLEGVVADPHLRARGPSTGSGRSFFEPVAQAGAGPSTSLRAGVREMEGLPYRFSLTPAHIRLPAPAFGEHTAAVLSDVLGLDATEIEALRARGVVDGSASGAQ